MSVNFVGSDPFAERGKNLMAVGAMACPPEDVGGLPGYHKLIEVLKDPGHPEYEDHMEWLDEQGYRNYDPVKFDLSKCNM